MERTARLFNCACCHRQVTLCSDCDRNNIYCGLACSQRMRKASLRMAGQRYQKSYQGRLKHAKRQSCYRSRLRNKVTHLTSPILAPHVVLSVEVSKPIKQKADDIQCQRCGKFCASFVRIGFLRHVVHHQASLFSSWPLAP